MRAFIKLMILCAAIMVLNACDQYSGRTVNPAEMVLVSRGEFIMGTDREWVNVNQSPAHRIFLGAFYIDKHEVTNAQYEEFILSDGYKNKKFWTKEGWDFIQKSNVESPLNYKRNNIAPEPDHPVIGVSWYEANAYSKWAGKRLPTEAEWEKAARGAEGRLYPWGSKMDFSKLSYFPHVTKILEVGSFPEGASAYGIMDMAGSVWEWTADWYSANYYKQSPKRNPKGPANGKYRVLRGGAWDSIRAQLQCTYRHYEKERRQTYTIGFRCVANANDLSSDISKANSLIND